MLNSKNKDSWSETFNQELKKISNPPPHTGVLTEKKYKNMLKTYCSKFHSYQHL